MDGIFNVLKPPGMTSHDVVGALRKILNMKKIGHGGTLDPLAAGVLPVFTGIATRFLEYAAHEEKSYRAELTFGFQTDTGDTEGKVIAQSPVRPLTDEEIEEERRLFYVAMTRAKRKLIISYVKEKNGKDLLPSRFVSELLLNV